MGRLLLALVSSAWVGGLVLGFRALVLHEITPGRVGTPSIARVEAAERYRLIVFIHPHCPCTSATLTELEKLTVKLSGRMEVKAFAVIPEGKSKEWADGSNLRWLEQWCDPQLDYAGKGAAAYGARTSGHVVLFSPTGERLFSGGITASRGHQGANVGSDTVMEVVRTGSSKVHEAPVFGCSLL